MSINNISLFLFKKKIIWNYMDILIFLTAYDFKKLVFYFLNTRIIFIVMA